MQDLCKTLPCVVLSESCWKEQPWLVLCQRAGLAGRTERCPILCVLLPQHLLTRSTPLSLQGTWNAPSVTPTERAARSQNASPAFPKTTQGGGLGSRARGVFLTAQPLVARVRGAAPRRPLRSTTRSHPWFADLPSQACGVPKLESRLGKQVIFYHPLSGARRTGCPVTRQVRGVSVGPQPVSACRLRDGHLPAESRSSAHRLLSYWPQRAPPGAQICHRLTWFLTTGLHLKHSVGFISCGNNTNSTL